MNALADMFGSIGTTVFRWSAILFLLVNAAAVAAFLATRSRALVNQWTPRLVAANLMLVGLGVGVPAVAFCLKTVVSAVASSEAIELRLADE